MKRILITGSRDWRDAEAIERAIFEWCQQHTTPWEQIIVVHGDARGADSMARDYARRMVWLEEEPHPADWSWGKSAGIQRNMEMIQSGADVCLAFIRNNSRGTRHCAGAALRAGIPVERHLDNDEDVT